MGNLGGREARLVHWQMAEKGTGGNESLDKDPRVRNRKNGRIKRRREVEGLDRLWLLVVERGWWDGVVGVRVMGGCNGWTQQVILPTICNESFQVS